MKIHIIELIDASIYYTDFNTKLAKRTFDEKVIFGSRYSRMDQVKFVEDGLKKFEVIWSA